ncbi:MAG TPA: hypothetical protein VGQ26_12750 [Streptosporangiaceae bacterium]|nr:hypothetical protein [Streptosporangiaceae bacterium]
MTLSAALLGLAASRAWLAVGVAGADFAVAVRAGQDRLGDVPAGVVDKDDRRTARPGGPGHYVQVDQPHRVADLIVAG